MGPRIWRLNQYFQTARTLSTPDSAVRTGVYAWAALLLAACGGGDGGGTSSDIRSTPVALDVTVSALEDNPVEFSVYNGSTSGSRYNLVTPPTHGTLLGVLPDITYRPLPDYSGQDEFSYTITDETGTSDPARVQIFIVAQNDAPQAKSINFTALTNKPIDVALTASDPDSALLSYRLLTQPIGGVINGTAPNIQYTARSGFLGIDNFSYVADDGVLDSAPATVTIAVIGSGGAATDPSGVGDDSTNANLPIAIGMDIVTREDSDVGITLNGSDPNNQTLIYAVIEPPKHGSLSGTAPALSYRPAQNYYGTDNFRFKVNNGDTDGLAATVKIQVTPINDAPNTPNMTVTAQQDTPTSITLQATDIDSSALTYSVMTMPSHGSLTGTAPVMSYQPQPGYIGPDTFSYRANDGDLNSATSQVNITVQAKTSDETPANEPPVSINLNLTTLEDTDLTLALAATDNDSTVLSYTLIDQPVNGTLLGLAPNLTYHPASNFNGTETFTYRASDGVGFSATAKVTITVTPVNDAPTAKNQSAILDQDKPANITLQASDIDSQNLIYSVFSLPGHGDLSGNPPNIIYTPHNDYFGSDSFAYKASDGIANSNVATVSITINKVNKAPIANGLTAAGDEDTSITLHVTANDVDSSLLTYRVTRDPQHGVISGLLPDVSYTPAANYNGTDSFEFAASDGIASSTPATVNLNIRPVNDAPQATDASVTTRLKTPVAVALAGVDVDNDTLSYSITEQPKHGRITGTPPSLTYTPDDAYSGSDTIVFQVADSQVASGPATVSITIVNNVAPVLSGTPSASIKANLRYEFKPTASDADKDPLTFTATHLPSWATLDRMTGAIAGTPKNSDVGQYGDITLTVQDGFYDISLPTFSIDVEPNPWDAKTDMPLSKRRSTAVTLNDKIHVIGGASSIDSALATFAGRFNHVFNPANNTWVARTPLLSGLTELTAHVVNNRIYAFGGLSIGGAFSNSVQIYDPDADAWSQGARMPTTRARFSSGVANARIYLIGGVNTTWANSNVVEEYDPATDSWQTKKPAPMSCSQATAEVVDNKIYVLGGWCQGTSKAVNIYDPASDAWTTGVAMNSPRRYLASAVIGTRLYAIGGYAETGLSSVEYFDFSSNAWTLASPLAQPQFAGSATSFGDKLYLIGGQADAQMFTPTTWEYDPAKENTVGKN